MNKCEKPKGREPKVIRKSTLKNEEFWEVAQGENNRKQNILNGKKGNIEAM